MTSDSFSDGGEFNDTRKAIDRTIALFESGADVVDLGAESTRPGADAIPSDVEWKKLEPVLSELYRLGRSNAVSVDTRHDETILRAAETYDIGWANNVDGLYDAKTLRALARKKDIKYVAMHKKGDPKTMQYFPLRKSEAVMEVSEQFAHYRSELEAAGFQRERTYFDPGIGFGKDDSANLELLFATPHFARSYQLCIGVSRKSMFGRLLGISDPKDRDLVSKVTEFALIAAGASMIRTHDVAPLSKLRCIYQS